MTWFYRSFRALALVLLCSGLAFGQAETEARFFSNYGGLNTKDSPILINDNESPDCQNVYFTTKGAIVKRNGYDRLNLTGVPSAGVDQITSFYQYIQDDGTEFAIVTAGAKLYKMESLDGTLDDITGSLSITADNNFHWITWKNTAIGTDNSDTNIIKWTGSGNGAALTVPTGLTRARDVVEYRNYLILLNVTVSGTAQPSRFYYSNLNTLNTWTDLDFIDVSPSDGDVLVGGIVLGGDLYLFKKFAIYRVRLTGDAVNPFIVQKTNSHVGALSTNGIVLSNNTIIFVANDGVYGFNGNTSQKISTKIDPTFDSLNKSNLSKAQIMDYNEDNQIWIASGTGSTHNRVLVFDYSNAAWTLHTGINAAVLGDYIASGDERIFHGDYSGLVFEDDTDDSDDGTAINAYWVSKWMDFGAPAYNKKVKHCNVVVEDSGNWDLTFGYSYDFQGNDLRTINVNLAGNAALWDTGIWDTAVWAGQSFLIKRLDILGQGKFFNVKFTNDNSDEPFTMYGYSLLLEPGSKK